MNINTIPTPSYVLDEKKLIKNLEILQGVQERTGCKILLAQKAFSMFSCYKTIGRYLTGTTASGLYEARLGHEEMGGETHIFSPAYKDEDFDSIINICQHVVFNSLRQLEKFRHRCTGISIGLRINPQHSTQGDNTIYDPCAPGSRLGVTRENFDEKCIVGSGGAILEGLHFHTLCEQNANDLATTMQAVEEQFGDILHRMRWLNMGGGHHITRSDYDIALLESIVTRVQKTYGVQVYLEPGEAIALNAGYLVCEVLDIVENSGITTLILDASAACHMPDVLEMPYRPPLKSSGLAGEKAYTYRLSSHTCLAGDIIGDYSFDTPKNIGDRLIFEDMAIYSMVKNNTFNGIALPNIMRMDAEKRCHLVKSFGYDDFKNRLS